jgi:ABC-type amino acid transport substrate-binding protein
MQRLIFASVLFLAASSMWTVVDACGDKFLMVGRSGRFNQAYAAIYPATILLYAPAGRAASVAILDPKFQSSLTRAGHRIEVVKTEEQAVQMLQAGRFDLVLSDAADADALKARAAVSPTQPTVMPVLINQTKADAEAIKTRYQCELKPSDRPGRYLSTIDTEMQRRVKQRASHKAS